MAGIYMLFTKRRTVFCAICFALLLIMPPIAAFAQPPGAAAFTVKDVKVDVTDTSAAAAREKAFGQAQQKAFQILAERLLSKNQFERFTLPEAGLISSLIKDFEITEEHLSSVRYVGTFTFRFKNDAVRNYLGALGLAYSDVASKPVLVLPYYQWGARTILWGDNNPWLAAWNRMQTYQGLVPVIVPIGDLQDVADIGDNEALTYSPDNLQTMTKRYSAGETIIMLAIPEWYNGSLSNGSAPPDRLTIMVYRTDRGTPEFANKLTITAKSGENPFETAVREARENLQQAWKSQTQVNPSQGNSLKVRVKFLSMVEWLETQKALRRVQGVNEVKLLSLTPNEANIQILFQGSEDRLRLALQQADMTLTSPRIDFGRSRYRQDFDNGFGVSNGGRGHSASPLVYDLYLNRYKPL